jgi:hypothetical protein
MQLLSEGHTAKKQIKHHANKNGFQLRWQSAIGSQQIRSHARIVKVQRSGLPSKSALNCVAVFPEAKKSLQTRFHGSGRLQQVPLP